MTRKIDDYIPGQSPLPPSWKKDLIPPINTYEELNEHESLNIQQVVQKYQFGGRKKWPVSDLQFVKRLHREMYGDVWTWAGEFRMRDQETNIGVEAGRISLELGKTCEDCKYWIENQSYSPIEIAVRYHYRIVFIHPFPNGNGRFSRFIGNLTMLSLGEKALPWGGAKSQLLEKLVKNTFQPCKKRIISASLASSHLPKAVKNLKKPLRSQLSFPNAFTPYCRKG